MKKYKKNKNFNKNQNSFYFEDFLETNKKDKIFKKNNTFQDRIYLLFFYNNCTHKTIIYSICTHKFNFFSIKHSYY